MVSGFVLQLAGSARHYVQEVLSGPAVDDGIEEALQGNRHRLDTRENMVFVIIIIFILQTDVVSMC